MQRRSFLRAIIPVAAMVGSSVSVLGHEGVVKEIRPDKRYVFHFPELSGNDRARNIQEFLVNKGFKDPIVFLGADLKLYELDRA